MKPIVLAGVVLLILGVAALAYQRFSYTTRDTVVDIGPVKVDADKQKTVLLPPVIGIAAVVGGVVLIAAGMRKSR
jgi:uncharacterized membrane protein HdeD (DUF308 family)